MSESKSNRDFWIAILALVISGFTSLYIVYTNEFGLLQGTEDYNLQVLDRLEVTNGIGALVIRSDLLIRNDGTRPFRIHKTRAMIWLGEKSKQLQSKSLLELKPKSSWRGKTSYFIDLSDGEWKDTTKLQTDISMHLLRERHNRIKKIEEVIFLPEHLMNRVESALDKNLEWLKEDNDYYIMFGYWVNEDDLEPSVIGLYKFRFDSYQKILLSSVQLESLKTPYKSIVKENPSLKWSALSRVTYIGDQHEIDQRYLDDFRRAFVKKPPLKTLQ